MLPIFCPTGLHSQILSFHLSSLIIIGCQFLQLLDIMSRSHAMLQVKMFRNMRLLLHQNMHLLFLCFLIKTGKRKFLKRVINHFPISTTQMSMLVQVLSKNYEILPQHLHPLKKRTTLRQIPYVEYPDVQCLCRSRRT